MVRSVEKLEDLTTTHACDVRKYLEPIGAGTNRNAFVLTLTLTLSNSRYRATRVRSRIFVSQIFPKNPWIE